MSLVSTAIIATFIIGMVFLLKNASCLLGAFPLSAVSRTAFPQATFFQITPTPTPSPIRSRKSEGPPADFFYPGSTQVATEGSSVTLESYDDPAAITEWYKDKIDTLGVNVTSFIQTNTNGNILNKLLASRENGQISVEIRKNHNDQKTKITVDWDL